MNPSMTAPLRPLLETIATLATAAGPPRAGDELHSLRLALRQQLLQLKRELATQLTERESYLALFALVVQLDELVRTQIASADAKTWPLLQKELFDTDRGGELFYQTLAELLETPKVAPLVYLVYYFCLRVGFRGKYAQEPAKRAQAMAKLRDRLTASVPDELELTVDNAPLARVPRLPSLAWPYAAAALVLLAVYVALSSVASAQVARWRAHDDTRTPWVVQRARTDGRAATAQR